MLINKDSLNDPAVRKILKITDWWERELKVGDFVSIMSNTWQSETNHQKLVRENYQITEIGDKIYFGHNGTTIGHLCIYHSRNVKNCWTKEFVDTPLLGFIIDGTNTPSRLIAQLEQNPELNNAPLKFDTDPEIKLSLTGDTNVDTHIFTYLSDSDVYTLSQTNKALFKTFNTEALWKLKTPTHLLKYKERYAKTETWKEFYKMMREFPYPCKELIKRGNQEFILDLLTNNDQQINNEDRINWRLRLVNDYTNKNMIEKWVKNLIEYGQYSIAEIFQDYVIGTFNWKDMSHIYVTVDNYEYLFTLERQVLYDTLIYISDTYNQGSVKGEYLFPVLFYGKHCDVLEKLISLYNAPPGRTFWLDIDCLFSQTLDYSDKNFDREVIDLILDATNSFYILSGHAIAQAAKADNMELVEYLIESVDARIEAGNGPYALFFDFSYYAISTDEILAFCLVHNRIDLYTMVHKHYNLKQEGPSDMKEIMYTHPEN